jgi:nucleoside-diphosphate-sugar epimerase
MAQTISIVGCGWYGLSLAKALVEKGFIVKVTTTTADKLSLLKSTGIQPYLINVNTDTNSIQSDFFDCDILWICIPPKTRSGKGDEYLAGINTLITAAQQHNIKQVILISSTSVYADDNSEVNELTLPNPDTESGKIMLRAEDMLKQENTFTTTIIRFAGLFGPGRDPGRFFGGKKDIPNGNAPVNLIHLTDCIGLSFALLDKKVFGRTFNACTPDHPSKAAFYTKASVRMGLEKPEFLDEKKDWKIVSSLFADSVLNYPYQIRSLIDQLDKPTD